MKNEEEIKLKINELENEAMLCLDGNSTGDDIRLEVNLALWELANWLLETKPKTKVKFLIDRDPILNEYDSPTYEIFAYFPEIKEASYSNLSYSHIGQHGQCDPEYIKECKSATPEQYKELYDELINIGYDLEILQ